LLEPLSNTAAWQPHGRVS